MVVIKDFSLISHYLWQAEATSRVSSLGRCVELASFPSWQGAALFFEPLSVLSVTCIYGAFMAPWCACWQLGLEPADGWQDSAVRVVVGCSVRGCLGVLC